MANSFFTTHIVDLGTQLPFRLYSFISTPNILLYSSLISFTSTIPITTTNTDNYLQSDDPNTTIFMVSHNDCEKQHTLRQFNLLEVKQCTEAPSNIQHASIKARVYVRAKAKRIKAYKCVAYAKKERKIGFNAQLNIDVLIELH